MHKNTLWIIFVILCIYFSLVLCEESTAVQALESKDSNDLLRSDTTAMEEEARTKRHRHHLYSLWGFYGLAIAYLVKIKVVVVAFFVGSAVYLSFRYLWPHRCSDGIYKEGSIVLDHPPSSFEHHDHIPYSLDHDHHHFDSSSFSSSGPISLEPYSAYSSNSFAESYGPPETILSDDGTTFRHKRSVSKQESEDNKVGGTLENLARQMVITEEKIGDFMFSFLGLDTNACRSRFICEMEFRSMRNPLTAMAFRVIGRSLFAKFTNDQNPMRKANSFFECAAVNPECVFIEKNEEVEEEPAQETEQQYNTTTMKEEEHMETDDTKTKMTTEENSLESNDINERENEKSLKAELRRDTHSYRRRLRGDRFLKLV